MPKIITASIASLIAVAAGAFLVNGTGAVSGAKPVPTATFTRTPTATPTATTVPTPTPAPPRTYWATGERPLCTGANPVECLAAEAFCDLGDPATGGGGSGPDVLVHPGSAVIQSYPIVATDGQQGWHIVVVAPYGGSFSAYAVCLDNPPAHVP